MLTRIRSVEIWRQFKHSSTLIRLLAHCYLLSLQA